MAGILDNSRAGFVQRLPDRGQTYRDSLGPEGWNDLLLSIRVGIARFLRETGGAGMTLEEQSLQAFLPARERKGIPAYGGVWSLSFLTTESLVGPDHKPGLARLVSRQPPAFQPYPQERSPVMVARQSHHARRFAVCHASVLSLLVVVPVGPEGAQTKLRYYLHFPPPIALPCPGWRRRTWERLRCCSSPGCVATLSTTSRWSRSEAQRLLAATPAVSVEPTDRALEDLFHPGRVCLACGLSWECPDHQGQRTCACEHMSPLEHQNALVVVVCELLGVGPRPSAETGPILAGQQQQPREDEVLASSASIEGLIYVPPTLPPRPENTRRFKRGRYDDAEEEWMQE
jgi:hypothetical protein